VIDLPSSIYLIALCYSALLSLMGIALTLRHKASGIPDFSTVLYMGLGVTVAGLSVSLLNLNLYASPLIAFPVGCIAGALYYRFIMRLMERRGDNTILRALATIGIQILGSSLLWIAAYWLDTRTGFTDTLRTHIFHSMQLYDFVLWNTPGIYYVIPLVCTMIYITLLLLLRRPTLRLSLVASEENPELAVVQGIDPWRLRLLIWSLSGGVACVAGSLFPPFLHILPGGEANLIAPVMAVGILCNFDSLALAVLAAFAVGLSEILGILWLQVNIGNWLGEYRAVIPIAILYFTMLIIPRGLVELKESSIDAKAGLSRLGLRRLLGLLALISVIVGLVAMANISRSKTLEDETWGWINVSTEVGRAGARIYPDTDTPELPSSLQFSKVYPPAYEVYIESLESLVTNIRNEGVTVVYRHDNALYIVRNPSFGYFYDPHSDNFGR
jgi:branched-chain amino acid transport system permease protein